MGDAPRVVGAAGTIPWRLRSGRVEVALVHRPRYDDWSWPKGKLDPGESWTSAAVRETWEETGLQVRLGRPLPTNRYALSRGESKEVRYWASEVVGGDGRLENEIDEVRWLPAAKARRLLTSPRDVAQIDAVARGPVATRTVMIVRHAHAVARKEWTGPDDRLRPLDEKGSERADAMAAIFGAYGISHVACSPSTRCVDTMTPYLVGRDVTTTWSAALSEEGHEAAPERLSAVLDHALAGTDPVAVCSHGPVLGPILDDVTSRYATPGKNLRRILRTVRRNNLDKGEALVLHVSSGRNPAVVAVERHRPSRS